MKLLFKFSSKYRRAMRIKKALLKAKKRQDVLEGNSLEFLMETTKRVKSGKFFNAEDLIDCSQLINIKNKKDGNTGRES